MPISFFIACFLWNVVTREPVPVDSSCEADWIQSPATSYCYFVYPPRTYWSTARDLCLELGGDLVSIHSPEEDAFIFSIQPGPGGLSWLGITDQENEGVFPFFSDGTPVDYLNFGDPSGAEYAARDCALMYGGHWYWNHCWNRAPVICKKPHGSISTIHPPSTQLLRDGDCYPDWVHDPTSGTCYLFWKSMRTVWEAAIFHCRLAGGDLASIHSAEENAFIFDIISRDVWIGISDTAHEGVFSNFSDGTPVDFQNFAVDDEQHDDRDCVYMNAQNGKWMWRECAVQSLAVLRVCKALNTTAQPILYPTFSLPNTTTRPTTTTHLATTTSTITTHPVTTTLPSTTTHLATTTSPAITSVPPTTTPLVTTSLPATTTQLATTPLPATTTQLATTPLPATTTRLATTTQLVTTTVPITTTHPATTTQPGTTTHLATTTPLPATTTPIATTALPATTTPIATTALPATTTQLATTALPAATTRLATTTQLATTTVPITTTNPATTQPGTTTHLATTTSPTATSVPATTTPLATTTLPATTTWLATTTQLATTTVPITTTHPATTTQPGITTHLATTTSPTTTSVPATTTLLATTEESHYILLELFLFPSVPVKDNIFNINDTVLALASIFGSYEPMSSEILWSITNNISGDSVHYTDYSRHAVLFRLTSPSSYSIKVTSFRDSFNLTATTIATVLPAAHIICPTCVFASSEVWCVLLTDNDVDHSNYTFCFEDSEYSCSMIKPRSWTLADLPDDLIDHASSINGFLASFINHTYTMTGSYKLTVEIFWTLAASIIVNVTRKPTCVDSLLFEKGHGNITHPALYPGALEIEISAHIELDEECIDPMTSDIIWKIFTSTEDNDVVTVLEEITHTPQLNIPSGTLVYGIYYLKMKVQTHQTSGDISGDEYITTWLKIHPSPLVAVIKGGDSRSHGLSSNLIVDGSTSYDPDIVVGSSSHLNFSWYCVMITPDTVYTSLDEAMQNADDSCFTEEGIMLNPTSSKIEILASKLEANMMINFWLIVSKEGRTSGSTQQRIQLTLGLLPQLEVSCINNCNKYMFTAERLVLLASCTNCDIEDITLQWSFESEHTPLPLDLSSHTTTGLNQPYLVIKPHTFDAMSETDTVNLRVASYLSNSSVGGYAEFSIEFNAPPTSGSCSITPTEGYALQTEFTVSCDGFTDVDRPLSYQMISYSSVDVVDGELVSKGEGLQLYEGSESIMDGFFLPVGDNAHDHVVLIQVNVRDFFMASTSVPLSPKVNFPSINVEGESATHELLNMTLSVESDVNTLLAEGDTGHAVQLISALGSILNSIEDNHDKGEQSQEEKETRSEIRSSLVDSVAAIPLESMVSLKQSSSALAVITENKQEISHHVQVKAANTLSEMTSFLKAECESSTQDQQTIESSAIILVEGMSNVLSAAQETKNQQSTNALDDEKEYSAKNVTMATLSAISDIQDAIGTGQIPSEEPTIITSPTLSIAVASISRSKLADASLGGSDSSGLGGFTMPSGNALDDILDDVHGATVSMQISSLKWNPFNYGPDGDTLNSTIVGIQLKADNAVIQVQDLSADISVFLPIEDTLIDLPDNVTINEVYSAFIHFNHSLIADDGAVHLKIIADNEPIVGLSICPANMRINKTGCVGDTTVVDVRIEDLDAPYFTWTVYVEELKAVDGVIISLYEGKDQPTYENDNITLTVSIHASQCKFWNEELQEWRCTGCRVGPLSTYNSTQCLCNHLTFFGSSIAVPPHEISLFTAGGMFLSFDDINPIVMSALSVILTCYVLGAVWARRKDMRDTARAAVTVLEDNNPYHQYRYNVTLVTGMRYGAGTTATVTLTLIGSKDSEPHVLHDRLSPTLTRGSTDSFLLTTAQSLGDIQAIRLRLYDDGGSPQWYLSHSIVHDLESNRCYYFLCNTWMVVGGEEDGLDNTFHRASSKDLNGFAHVFQDGIVRSLQDSHLWLSVLMRPKHSKFTSLQRVSCCMSLIMCSMLTCAMLYGLPNDQEDGAMGKFRITMNEIIIGIESSIIAFPINLLIVQIFRYSRPRRKHLSSACKDKYVAAGPPDIITSLSSSALPCQIKESRTLSSAHETEFRPNKNFLTSAPREDCVVAGTPEVTNSLCRSISSLQIENSPQQTQERQYRHFADAADSFSTSTTDDNLGNYSAIPSASPMLPCISINSSLFHQEMDHFVLRSVSAIMKEWGSDVASKHVETFGHGGLDKVGKHQGETQHDPAKEVDNVRFNFDPQAVLQSNEKFGVTHNYYLYSRLIGIVKELTETSSDRFYKPEEHEKALIKAQTIFMTALELDTPSITPDESMHSESLPSESLRSSESMPSESLHSESGHSESLHSKSVHAVSMLSELMSEPKVKRKHRMKGLPHWCVYIAWLLVLGTVLASSFITLLYGLWYGKQTSIDWLISLFIATFQSICIIQPIKFLFVALFGSLVRKQIKPEHFSHGIKEREEEDAIETHEMIPKQRAATVHQKPPND